jgi:NAD(P)-dependent dehydrogenase (short-subunit alcohol dehydrogenase family)
MDVTGRAALVTGGASGIGAATAAALAAAGADVVTADLERAPILVDLRRGEAARMVARAARAQR